MQVFSPSSDQLPSTSFSLSQTRKIVADLFEPNPKIYWADFLLSWICGVVCFRLVREFPLFSLPQIGLFVISALAYYRAGIFTHELVHLRPNKFKGFRIVWNLLAGIPFLIPSFTYYTHVDHHRRSLYGTREDGEYLPLGVSTPWAIVLYLSQIIFVPALTVVRFGLLTPLTWISPQFRNFVLRHASTMVADPRYIRPLPGKKTMRIIRLQELGCFLFIVTASILLARGRVPMFVLYQAYLTGCTCVAINCLRTLGAHRYMGEGEEMTFIDQLVDSVNYSDRSLLAAFWAPLGLKYHALHHVFPSMPYHNMGTAHRRLMRELPADSPYRRTEADSLLVVLGELWTNAAASGRPSVEARRAA